MADTAFQIQLLMATPALGFQPETIGSVVVSEVTDAAMVTVAFDASQSDDILDRLSLDAWKNTQAVGQSAVGELSGDLECRFALLQPGQLWIMAHCEPETLMQSAHALVSDSAWLTDQSDGWAIVSLDGKSEEDALTVLSRLCMLDLSTLPDGTVSRTLVAHMSVIVLKQSPTKYWLLGARSLADDLLHSVRQAARNAA